MHDGNAAVSFAAMQTQSVLSLTDGDGGDVLVLFGSEVSNQAASVISWHRAHQHWSSGLDLSTTNEMGLISLMRHLKMLI